MKFLGSLSLVVGTALFVVTVYLLLVSLGFRKGQCSKCKGYLTATTHHKNKYVGGKRGRFYKHYSDYVYEYRVNGQTFTISGGIPGTKSNLNHAVEVIYQKRRPQYAYIRKLTLPVQPLLLLFSIPLCVLFLLCGVGLVP